MNSVVHQQLDYFRSLMGSIAIHIHLFLFKNLFTILHFNYNLVR